MILRLHIHQDSLSRWAFMGIISAILPWHRICSAASHSRIRFTTRIDSTISFTYWVGRLRFRGTRDMYICIAGFSRRHDSSANDSSTTTTQRIMAHTTNIISIELILNTQSSKIKMYLTSIYPTVTNDFIISIHREPRATPRKSSQLCGR